MTKGVNIFVEGNIASGKTNLMNALLEANSNIELFSEPLKKWQNLRIQSGKPGKSDAIQNLFLSCYKAKETSGFNFAMYVLLTMLQRQQLIPTQNIRLYERSLESGYKCFLHAKCHDNQINETHRAILKHWYKFVSRNLLEDQPIDLIIYIRTEPVKALKRIQQRGRTEEREIGLDYLRLLNKVYENWIQEKMICYPIIIIDGEKDPTELKSQYMRCLCKINEILLNKNCPPPKTLHELMQKRFQYQSLSNDTKLKSIAESAEESVTETAEESVTETVAKSVAEIVSASVTKSVNETECSD